MLPSKNVLGQPLQTCSVEPMTGWFRDGCCNTDERDRGSHTVCAVVTAPFLAYLQSRGNDLITPAPHHAFPGLKPGDRWCVCAASWLSAHREGVGCPVVLEATHEAALEIVPLEAMLEHAVAVST